MAVPVGRSEKRIAKKTTVELARPDVPQIRETAFAQNLSGRGMQVTTESFWRPGDHVLLTESGLRIQARVVYCHRLENNSFCVGLELLDPPEERTKRR
jgi:PilZ domain